MMRRPGWKRLVRHSYRLGVRWLTTGRRQGWRGARGGLNRLLVPLDPWRFYELGRIADEPFSGRCLDVASPKLLPSLLAAEGQGMWIAIDLLSEEIDRWRILDPSLNLEVQDARSLPWPDASFDRALCVSVVEHIAGDGDAAAMAEIWRVLASGGLLHLTTNVARRPNELWAKHRDWGEVQEERDGQVFFERHYDPETVVERLLARPWEVVRREWVAERRPWIAEVFYGLRPASYIVGGLLRFICPRNFRVSDSPDVLPQTGHGVVYLQLRKPQAV